MGFIKRDVTGKPSAILHQLIIPLRRHWIIHFRLLSWNRAHSLLRYIYILNSQILVCNGLLWKLNTAMFDHNVTNVTTARYPMWKTHRGLLELWIACMLLIGTFGAALNALLFSAIVSSRKLRSGTGTLIAHSILLEATLCGLVLPLFTASFWTSLYYPPSKMMCQAVMGLLYTFVWAFNWSTVPVAVNRIIAICFPQNYSTGVAKRPLLVAILFTWTVSISCSTVVLSDTVAGVEVGRQWGGCKDVVRRPAIYGGFFALGATAPIALEGLMYGCLFSVTIVKRKFRIRRSVDDRQLSEADAASLRKSKIIRGRRLKVTQTVFAAYVWSAMCFMFGPIVVSAARSNPRLMALVPLVAPALILMGFATSPVRLMKPPNNSGRFLLKNVWLPYSPVEKKSWHGKRGSLAAGDYMKLWKYCWLVASFESPNKQSTHTGSFLNAATISISRSQKPKAMPRPPKECSTF